MDWLVERNIETMAEAIKLWLYRGLSTLNPAELYLQPSLPFFGVGLPVGK